MAEKYEPDARTAHDVKTLAGVGVQHVHIAAKFGISVNTLRKYYKRELDAGKAEAIADAATRLFKKVQEDNLTAIIFYLKTQAGWSEKLDLSNTDGTLQPRTKIKRIVVNSAEEVVAIKQHLTKLQEEKDSGAQPVH